MDLNHVELFVRVVEKGSFTTAAREVGLPKSSVSRSVAKLERELGVTLLRRTTRSLQLTDAGRTYFEQARSGIATLDKAKDLAMDSRDEPHGRVRMTAPAEEIIRLALATLFARFLAEYPSIHIELQLTSRFVDLLSEGVDLALRAGPLPDSSLVARRVGSSSLGLFASPEYVARRGSPKRFSDLAEHDCVLYQGAQGGKETWALSGPRGREEVLVRGPLGSDERSFSAFAAINGIGIALLPYGVASHWMARDALVRILPEYSLSGAPVHILHAPMKHLPRRVALLKDFLVKELPAITQTWEMRCTEGARRARPKRRDRASAQ